MPKAMEINTTPILDMQRGLQPLMPLVKRDVAAALAQSPDSPKARDLEAVAIGMRALADFNPTNLISLKNATPETKARLLAHCENVMARIGGEETRDNEHASHPIANGIREMRRVMEYPYKPGQPPLPGDMRAQVDAYKQALAPEIDRSIQLTLWEMEQAKRAQEKTAAAQVAYARERDGRNFDRDFAEAQGMNQQWDMEREFAKRSAGIKWDKDYAEACAENVRIDNKAKIIEENKLRRANRGGGNAQPSAAAVADNLPQEAALLHVNRVEQQRAAAFDPDTNKIRR